MADATDEIRMAMEISSLREERDRLQVIVDAAKAFNDIYRQCGADLTLEPEWVVLDALLSGSQPATPSTTDKLVRCRICGSANYCIHKWREQQQDIGSSVMTDISDRQQPSPEAAREYHPFWRPEQDGYVRPAPITVSPDSTPPAVADETNSGGVSQSDIELAWYIATLPLGMLVPGRALAERIAAALTAARAEGERAGLERAARICRDVLTDSTLQNAIYADIERALLPPATPETRDA